MPVLGLEAHLWRVTSIQADISTRSSIHPVMDPIKCSAHANSNTYMQCKLFTYMQ